MAHYDAPQQGFRGLGWAVARSSQPRRGDGESDVAAVVNIGGYDWCGQFQFIEVMGLLAAGGVRKLQAPYGERGALIRHGTFRAEQTRASGDLEVRPRPQRHVGHRCDMCLFGSAVERAGHTRRARVDFQKLALLKKWESSNILCVTYLCYFQEQRHLDLHETYLSPLLYDRSPLRFTLCASPELAVAPWYECSS